MNPLALIFASVLGSVNTAGALEPAASSVSGGRVALGVTLKLREPEQLAQLIDTQSDPNSPMYAHFLTPAQFRATFAPTLADYATTLATLRGEGFRIERTWAGRTLVEVSASPATVMRTFGTRGGLARISVPRELGAVAAVVDGGLPQARLNASAPGTRPIGAVGAVGAPTRQYGPDGGFSPQALTTAYDFPIRHGFDGRGVTVADTIDNPDNDANIAMYLQNFGLKRRVPASTIVGVPFGGFEDFSQPDIDAEGVLGVAPGVNYYVYDTDFLVNENIVALFTKIVSDNVADVVNTSFAVCETNDPLVFALQPLLAQGVAQGIAFEGVQFGEPSTCDISGVDPIEYPGGDPKSVAVGASNLIEDRAQSAVAESALPATGGGVSLYLPLPSFQRGVTGVDPAGRNTPDLVIAGEINSVGPSAYFSIGNGDGGETTGWLGGFPFADNAPVAGMLAEIQQMVHHRLGAFDMTLYRLFAKSGYGTAFHDVTTGCDGFAGSVPLCARSGYDVTSGIGSVDAYRLGKMLER